jgi:hypothetical protein
MPADEGEWIPVLPKRKSVSPRRPQTTTTKLRSMSPRPVHASASTDVPISSATASEAAVPRPRREPPSRPPFSTSMHASTTASAASASSSASASARKGTTRGRGAARGRR